MEQGGPRADTPGVPGRWAGTVQGPPGLPATARAGRGRKGAHRAHSPAAARPRTPSLQTQEAWHFRRLEPPGCRFCCCRPRGHAQDRPVLEGGSATGTATSAGRGCGIPSVPVPEDGTRPLTQLCVAKAVQKRALLGRGLGRHTRLSRTAQRQAASEPHAPRLLPRPSSSEAGSLEHAKSTYRATQAARWERPR